MRIAALLAVLTLAATVYWWRTRPMGWYKQDNGGLYRIKENGKFGYMDRSGRTVIPPQFDDAGDFSEGLSAVRVGNKAGFINREGRIVVTPQFDEADTFVYGRALVKFCCGRWNEPHPATDRFGYIDSDGKYVGSPEFLWVGPFSGDRSSDLAPVQLASGSFGFVTRSGKIAIPATFETVSIFGFMGGPAPVRSGGKWGYISRTGKWVIDPQFDNAWNFTAGLAPVAVSGKWGYIDSSGKFVVNPQFDDAFDFDDNDHAPVRNGGKWTFIDRKGIPIGDQVFLDISRVSSEGFRAARTSEGWGFVQGTHFVIRPLFDSADRFLGGLARVTIGGQQVYVDKQGTYAGDPFKGRAIRPTHEVREVWEGNATAPKFNIHEQFILIREGAKIKGFYSSPVSDPSRLGNFTDVAADLNLDDSFRLNSEYGLVWKGRFLAPVVIAGTRPNWEDGKAPEYPFRLQLVRDATPHDMPAPLRPTNSNWNAFLGEFKEAVAQRDQASLAVMLGRTFYLQNSRITSVDDVFRQLEWQQLAKALTDGVSSDRKSSLGRRLEFITDTPPCSNCVYKVTLTFGEDADGQWRWTGVFHGVGINY